MALHRHGTKKTTKRKNAAGNRTAAFMDLVKAARGRGLSSAAAIALAEKKIAAGIAARRKRNK